ncbi:clostripain-related cysteine peptidase [Ideonella sp. BN130291]|uniref:clostripain-related cysteine peptidase n=1 Tax=Ideonella sp. BN130291 TaxID=3112940 RepID=UPI002E273907|nr:clostripain-related cysteine peptidase [Ideonella sp. BN130291]
MALPNLLPPDTKSARTEGVTLAVYAPFGTDEVLSTFPDGQSTELAQHPLFKSLLKVAEAGVHVAALIDLVEDDTYLVEIPAGQPADVRVSSRWKEQMDSPHTLAGFLRTAHSAHPESALVLALEGHGAGFLPDIDRRKLTAAALTQNNVSWHVTPEGTSPTLPTGGPLLPTGGPLLPTGGPLLPANHMPLSTYGLGAALKSALDSGVPKLAAIHFNNCFNMSVEVLHTVAPYAEYATGYLNYNFFTSGASYPAVFQKLAQAGSASAEQLAKWFADENHAALAAKGNHPTAGGVVQLTRMQEIAERIDDLADALLSALRTATGTARPAVVSKIRHAILKAQQFDTEATMELEAPDELTDILSFATALLAFDFGPHKVHSAALALQQALKGIKRYGDNDAPWPAPTERWDFSSPALAMNIFLPDPTLSGLWDWRSPYYLEVNPDPTLPRVQPNIIEFLKVTDWVDFIIEYHKEAKFIGLLPAMIPEFPVFNAKYEPPRKGDTPRGDDGCNGSTPNDPPYKGGPVPRASR